jgi:hypothetical protein
VAAQQLSATASSRKAPLLLPPIPPICPPSRFPLLQPYCIAFDRVACGSIFHQCVYVLCEAGEATLQVGGWVRAPFSSSSCGVWTYGGCFAGGAAAGAPAHSACGGGC